MGADESGSHFSIRLFGPFEVRLDGRPLTRFSRRKAQTLLALLALRPGCEVERQWLAGLLWPDASPSSASQNLRNGLGSLRQALGPAAGRLLAPSSRTLSLDLTGAFVDVLAFDAAIARAGAAESEGARVQSPGSGDEDRASSVTVPLAEAVALYRGPLLEGWAEEWVFQEQQVREQAYLSALEKLAAQAREREDVAAAECHLRRAVATDPLRESAQRALMELLATGGNYAAALLAYRELRHRLHRELNTDPDADTQALLAAIRAEARRRAARAKRGKEREREGERDYSGITGREGAAGSLALSLPPSLTLPPAFLPAQATPLIGREREVASAVELLGREQVRLLVFTGPGGTGKTRLGVQVAAEVGACFAEGVFFVDLAPIRDPAIVVSTIAHALHVKESAETPVLESLKASLREKQMLLLLDNFEQVLEAAPLVAELLAAAPRLKVLVTSRAALHLRGEHEFAVPPLALPERGAWSRIKGQGSKADDDRSNLRPLTLDPRSSTITQYAAVQLFIQRAMAARAEFALTNENAPAVAEICHRLHGLPLAIELAAARIKVLSPQALLARLERRLPLLTGGARDLPARQQTMRDTIAWSFHLLGEEEQLLFQRLSVFVGGFTLEAAEAVCSEEGVGHRGLGVRRDDRPPTTDDRPTPIAQGLTPEAVLDLLTSLVDKSLVWREELADGEPRFGMWETIREYGVERLRGSGKAESVGRRHAHCFLALAEEAEPALWGPEAVVWMDRLEREHNNLRAALEWCQTEGRTQKAEGSPDQSLLPTAFCLLPSDTEAGLRIGGALREFWEVRGYLREGRGHLEGLLALPTAHARTVGRAKALRCAGRLTIYLYLGDRAATRALLEESLAIFQELGMKRDIAWTLYYLGDDYFAQGHGGARAPLEESLAIFRELGDKVGIASGLNSLGREAHRQGDYRAARALGEQSLAIYRELGYKRGIGWVLADLARILHAQGDGDRARALGAEALAVNRELGMELGINSSLNFLGMAAREQGEYVEARARFEESLAISSELGDRGQSAVSLLHLARISLAEEDWAKARALYEESLTLLRELSMELGVAWTLGHLKGACMEQGQVLLELGDYAAARARYEEGLALRRAAEDAPGVAWALVEAGHAAWLQGEQDVTQSHAEEALALFQASGNQEGILAALESLAVAVLARGQKERAARLLGAVESLREALELAGPDGWRRPRERMRDAVRAASLEKACATLWTEGRAMPLQQALGYALESLSTSEGT